MEEILTKEKTLISHIPNITFINSSILARIQFEVSFYQFEIHISPKYPQVPPRVICTTSVPFPNLNYGRDILSCLLLWTSESNSLQIIESIPNLLDSHNWPTEIAEFQLLSVYPMEIWDNQQGMAWFYCTEIDPCNEKLRKNRIVVVTHSKFLLFHPINNENLGVLVFWADLIGISQVRRCKNSEELFLIEWKNEIGGFLLFKSRQIKEFIRLVSENLISLGSIVQESFNIEIEDNEDRYKLYQILREIEKNERVLETEVDNEKIYRLIGLYQKAVEYFSAENDSRLETYLEKLHALLNDVRVLKQIFKGQKPLGEGRKRIMSHDRKQRGNGSEEFCDKTSSESL